MPGITGFIDYMPDTGEPFLGLIVEENTMRTQFFLATKRTAFSVVRALNEQLTEMAKELRDTPDKIVVVNNAEGLQAQSRRGTVQPKGRG